VPDCIAEVHGLKWAGTELPGVRVGSFHDADHVTFAVCHGHNPGIVIDLAGLMIRVPNGAAISLRVSGI